MSVLDSYHCTVQPNWIDYNGHLSEAYYVLAFGFATDQVMDGLGLDAAYRSLSGCSLYTVEAHVRYLAETGEGAALTITTTIVDAGAKKLHLAHEMRSGGTLLATEELLALHVDSGTGRSIPFPKPVATAIIDHQLPAGVIAPDWIGRAVSL
ncbi:thioesterase family protein [Cryobacterium sp. PH31-L1]|uniref:thioesterase family protein n=1 Tax=Cryobacterium sp. PH31-L1 TaxID=3046199 RepID=UPI0024B8BF40|nr:thioesterase family protein [Cryobacterium sp. PH31-L1]MDJ0375932.1 thioesterase family protein [Cryobacterium sp. PH31-L1]